MGWWILGIWFSVVMIVVSATDGEASTTFLVVSIIVALAAYFIGIEVRHRWKISQGQIYRKNGPAVEIQDFQFGHWYDTYTNTWVNNHPDSAGGWDIKFTLLNTGVKVIHYVHAYFYPIDTVGNRCAPTSNVKYTGSLSPAEKCKDLCYRHNWYNLPVGNVVFEELVVEFEDGSSQTIKYNHNGMPYVEEDLALQPLKQQTSKQQVPIQQPPKQPTSNLQQVDQQLSSPRYDRKPLYKRKYGVDEFNVANLSAEFNTGMYDLSSRAWHYSIPDDDQPWGIEFSGSFHQTKTTSKLRFSVVPCDISMKPLDGPTILSTANSQYNPNEHYKIWWSGLWKGMPVRNIIIEKVECFYTDGTSEVFTK